MTGTIETAFRGTLGAFALDAAFAVPASGVTALFGPSGSGKTSVLRCMTGLQRLGGRCVVAGDVWQDEAIFRPPHRRPVGFVFQEASLFPHLSVRRNLLFGAPKGGGSSLDEVVALLGLGALLDRAPHGLSGGERQRVAIGRALLSRPALLLMDEPLSALDRAAKGEILPFLERLHERAALPILYVTHSLDEVERLADHVVLLENGRVVASGPLATIGADTSLPLAVGRDAAVVLDVTVTGHDGASGLMDVAAQGGRFRLPVRLPARAGERRRLRVGAGDVSLALAEPEQSTILNVLPARIRSVSEAGPHEVVAVLTLGHEGEGARLLSRVTRHSWERVGLAVGQAVYAQVKSVALARNRSGAKDEA